MSGPRRRGHRTAAYTSSGEVVDHGGAIDWGTSPESAKLYQGDTLIKKNTFSGDLQNAVVPDATLPYRLVHDASRASDTWRLSTRSHTEWRFVSGHTDPLTKAPLALLELNYHLNTDLRGDASAGSTQKISLEAGPQAGGGPSVGTVNSVTLQLSYDDGATWTPVTLSKASDGRWSAMVKLPKQAGFISTRASATTDAGWSIDQDVIRAYGLG